MERRLFEVTLDATRGNRSRAAEMLGVSLRTVRNKIRDYGLPPQEELRMSMNRTAMPLMTRRRSRPAAVSRCQCIPQRADHLEPGQY